MGINWPWSKAETKSTAMTTRDLIESMGLQNVSAAGMPITMTQATGVVDVLACARVIARGLAQVPLKLFRPLPGGGSVADNSRLGRLLHRQPNKFQSAYRFRNMMGLHLVLTGAFAAYINRAGGEIVELLPLPPGRVRVDGTMWDPKYFVDFGKGFRQVAQSSILYIIGDTLDGVTEMPVTQYARDAIGLSIATDTHASKFFRNGGAAGGHYTTDVDINTTERKAIIDAIRDMESQQDSAFRKSVLWNGLKYEHTSYAPEQAQLREIRDQQTEHIARALNVNPIMIGFQGGKTPTYASAEQLFTAHVVYTLTPWYEMVEQELWRQLLSDEQKDAGYEYKHLAQGLMRGSHKDRAEYVSKMRNAGAITGNEIRALDEINPLPGGDDLWRPENMAVVGQEETLDEITAQNYQLL